ncbi:membrane magnesium transporter-like isoform X1 [Trifolium pratense]|uniref:membrane magnesium transporter-like isoform X1 n=1 Tax=Trifolium pratense TaxID=57577 RepID=UPI001E6902EB|nr:membrane magnesium transporter-like isoform X1 [Trifolium pratense]
MGLGFAIGFIGVLILFHAAYSTIQYRTLLKITEEEFSGSPLNVVIELSLGLLLCTWAALTVPGKFLCILPHSEENRILLLSEPFIYDEVGRQPQADHTYVNDLLKS